MPERPGRRRESRHAPLTARRHRRHLGAIAIGLGSLLTISLVSATAGAAAPTMSSPAAASGRLLTLESCRLLDSRNETRFTTTPSPGTEIVVPVAGRCRVPKEASAVVVVLTAIRASGAGWLAIYPTESGWPGTSSLNLDAGETRSISSVTAIDANGSLAILNDAGGHVTLDVLAAFVPSEASSEGRFVPVPTSRVLDTRATGRPEAADIVRVPLPYGVPADALAIAANITTTETKGAGYIAVSAAGSEHSPTAVVQADRAGQTRATSVVIPITAAGFDVFTSRGDHIIVDVAGYFTGPSAAVSGTGLFVPITPARLIDSRLDRPALHPGGARQFAISEITGAGVAAVVANVTMVEPRRAGWVLAYPAQTVFPEASTVNGIRSETVANQAIVSVSTSGLAAFSSDGTDIVIDISGAFTGSPTPATEPPAVNPEPPRSPGRTLIVGDSVAAVFHHVPRSRDPLHGLDHVLDVSSCRRTVGTSGCVFGNHRPADALTAINSAPGPLDTIVMVTGYNDWHAGMPTMIDQVMTAARRRGADTVYWLTLNTRGQGDYARHRDNYQRINQHLIAAGDRATDLEILDWNRHSSGRPSWFAADGIHLTPAGGTELARFIAAQMTSG